MEKGRKKKNWKNERSFLPVQWNFIDYEFLSSVCVTLLSISFDTRLSDPWSMIIAVGKLRDRILDLRSRARLYARNENSRGTG